MNELDLSSLWLTLKLAITTTLILLLVGVPIAWYLSISRSFFKKIIGSIIALPLVLPPTVLGFYLLILMGPQGPLGKWTQWLGIGTLSFTFSGLVLGSVLYSMPFVVQPIQNAMESINVRYIEIASTLGAGPWDRFFSVILPLSLPGIWTASILGFAHTVGEFGVVLMIGGNIPGETKVLSVAIYDHVEALEYSKAHEMAIGMLIFSFLILFLMYSLRKQVRISL